MRQLLLITRVYKDYDTNKITGVRLVNLVDLTTQDINLSIIKQMLRNIPDCILNARLNNGKLQFRNLNKNSRIKYYESECINNVVIQHYCFVTMHKNGLFRFLADTPEADRLGVINYTGTIGEMTDILRLESPNKLILFNGSITDTNNKLQLEYTDIFTHEHYDVRAKSYIHEVTDIFGKEWDVKITDATSYGMSIGYMKHLGSTLKEYKMPEGILQLNRFNGGVGSLDLLTVKSLGRACFANVKDIVEVRLNPHMIEIPADCFANSSIAKVVSWAYEIGERAFYNCNKLGAIAMADTRIIRKEAFKDSSIQSFVSITLQKIETEAFMNCKNLVNLSIRTVQVIETRAFMNCSKLPELLVLPMATKIEKDAFRNCKNLCTVIVPKSAVIEKGAFDFGVAVERM